VPLVEVIRPKREWRRRRGKSDPTDAEAAARAALSGEANGTPKNQDGQIEAIRLLRLARRSAILARTQAHNQLHSIVETAPAALRERLRHPPSRSWLHSRGGSGSAQLLLRPPLASHCDH
jgi:transposase